jgi:hypothetical protein
VIQELVVRLWTHSLSNRGRINPWAEQNFWVDLRIFLRSLYVKMYCPSGACSHKSHGQLVPQMNWLINSSAIAAVFNLPYSIFQEHFKRKLT